MRELRLGCTAAEGHTVVDSTVLHALQWAVNDRNPSVPLLPRLRSLTFVEGGPHFGWTLSSFLAQSIVSLYLSIELENDRDQDRVGIMCILESLPIRCPSLRHLALIHHSHTPPASFIASFEISIPKMISLQSLDLSYFHIDRKQFLNLINLPQLHVLVLNIDMLDNIPYGTPGLPCIHKLELHGHTFQVKHLCIIDCIKTMHLNFNSLCITTQESMSSDIVGDLLASLRPMGNMKHILLLWSGGPQPASTTLSDSHDHIRPDTLSPLLGFPLLDTFRTNISASFEDIDDVFIGQIAAACPVLRIFDLATQGLNHTTKVTLHGLIQLCSSCYKLESLGLYFNIDGIHDLDLGSLPHISSTTNLAVGYTSIVRKDDVKPLADFICTLFPKLRRITFKVDMSVDYDPLHDASTEPHGHWKSVIDILRGCLDDYAGMSIVLQVNLQ